MTRSSGRTTPMESRTSYRRANPHTLDAASATAITTAGDRPHEPCDRERGGTA